MKIRTTGEAVVFVRHGFIEVSRDPTERAGFIINLWHRNNHSRIGNSIHDVRTANQRDAIIDRIQKYTAIII